MPWEIIRWAIGGLLLAFASICILANATVPILYVATRKPTGSMVPIVGGIAACSGVLILPLPVSITTHGVLAIAAFLLDLSVWSLVFLLFLWGTGLLPSHIERQNRALERRKQARVSSNTSAPEESQNWNR